MKMHDENSGPRVSQMKRGEQIKRWEEADINKESTDFRQANKIRFSDSTIFLAACSANDIDEVNKLIKKGADINTANVDGLSALHQACIDDNLQMVQYLVQHGADINQGDNEGWTPLHAAASCGFMDIVEYLIKSGANLAAVNSDGDLPLDITDSKEIEKLLQGEIEKRGISVDDARNEEMNKMLRDVKLWLRTNVIRDRPHPKTGATALHVAAAKGYIPVIKLLIDAGVNVNAQDFDGWTPLHAASHWSQKEAVKVLLENKADPDKLNNTLLTPSEVGDNEMAHYIEEIKCESFKSAIDKVTSSSSTSSLVSNKTPPATSPSLPRKNGVLPLTGASNVIRMSGAGKTNLNLKDHMDEHETLAVNRQLLRRKTSTEDEESPPNRTAATPSTNSYFGSPNHASTPAPSQSPAMAAFKKVKTSLAEAKDTNEPTKQPAHTGVSKVRINDNVSATIRPKSPEVTTAVQFSITAKTINKDGTRGTISTKAPLITTTTSTTGQGLRRSTSSPTPKSQPTTPFAMSSHVTAKGTPLSVENKKIPQRSVKSTNMVPPLARSESTASSSTTSSESESEEDVSDEGSQEEGSESSEGRPVPSKSAGNVKKAVGSTSKIVSPTSPLSPLSPKIKLAPTGILTEQSTHSASAPATFTKYPYAPKTEGHKGSASSTSSTSSSSPSSSSTSSSSATTSTHNQSDVVTPTPPKKPSTMVTPLQNVGTKNSTAYSISSHRYQSRPELLSPTTNMLGGLASKYSNNTSPVPAASSSPGVDVQPSDGDGSKFFERMFSTSPSSGGGSSTSPYRKNLGQRPPALNHRQYVHQRSSLDDDDQHQHNYQLTPHPVARSLDGDHHNFYQANEDDTTSQVYRFVGTCAVTPCTESLALPSCTTPTFVFTSPPLRGGRAGNTSPTPTGLKSGLTLDLDPLDCSSNNGSNTGSSTSTFATLLQRYQRNCGAGGMLRGIRLAGPIPSTPYHNVNPHQFWSQYSESTSSPLNTTSQLNQNQLPAARVEETSEAQRKVRSKRARESRRSTQGVTPEDIKAAERQLEDIENHKLPSLNVRSTSPERSKTDPQNRENSKTPPPIQQRLLPSTTSSPAKETFTTSAFAPDRKDKTEKTARVYPLKVEQPPTKDLPPYKTTPGRVNDNDSTSQSSVHNNSSLSSGNASLTGTTCGLNSSTSRRPVKDYEERRRLLEEQRQKAIEERKNALGLDASNTSATPTTLEIKRHMREKRRSTGICAYSGDNDGQNTNIPELGVTKNNILSDDDRLTKPTFESDTPSSAVKGRPFSSTRSLASSDDSSRDYKKLYEVEKDENTKLKARVEELEAEIKASKSERKALAEVRPTEYDNSDTFTARREKRLLERKVAELEEEIKKMETLKEANQRLKHENGALIRVISKLSK